MFVEVITITSAVLLCIIFLSRHLALSKGKVFYHNDGFSEFLNNSNELYVYLVKVLKYFRKIFVQYAFHFVVRVLYYVKSFFDFIYSKARESFLKKALKDKKTVARFWDTLKEYKQEIDQESKK